MSKTLGIFTGKKSEYNGLILKSLVTGARKTMQIAEYVYLNQKDAPSQVNYNSVKQINSIICRKNSRRDELADKGYIRRENNLWKLTFKGFSVALTLFNDFADVKSFIDFTQIERNFKDALAELDRNPIYALLRTTEADNIIREGINIDSMSELDLKLHLAYKILFWMIGGTP